MVATDVCERFAETLHSKGATDPTYPIEERQNGQNDDGDSNTVQLGLPPWFDRARFDASRTILGEHFFALFFSHLAGLVLLVYIESIRRVLSLTGNSKNLVSIFYRYLHTLQHVKLWYEGIVYQPNEPAYHSLLKV